MPTYDFENGDGQRIERFFHMSDVPDSFSDDHGNTWTRCIAGGILASAQVSNQVRGYPYVSHQLPADTPGVKRVFRNGTWKAAIMSPRHEKEVMARNNLARELD